MIRILIREQEFSAGEGGGPEINDFSAVGFLHPKSPYRMVLLGAQLCCIKIGNTILPQHPSDSNNVLDWFEHSVRKWHSAGNAVA